MHFSIEFAYRTLHSIHPPWMIDRTSVEFDTGLYVTSGFPMLESSTEDRFYKVGEITIHLNSVLIPNIRGGRRGDAPGGAYCVLVATRCFLHQLAVGISKVYPLFQAETYPAMYRSAPADEYLNFPLVE